MSGFWPKNQQAASALAPQLSAGPSTDIGENYAAARADQKLNNNGASHYLQLGQAYTDRVNEVKRITGVQLKNPITAIPILPPDEFMPGQVEKQRRLFIDNFEGEVDKLREQYPDLPSYDDMRVRIKERSAAIEGQSADIGDRATFMGKVGGFGGVVVGALEDPLIGSSLVFGVAGGATIMRAALTEGAIAGGTELIVQPQVQLSRKERGLKGGLKQGAANVAAATVGGAVIGGGAAGLEKLFGRKLIRAFDEKVAAPTAEQKTARDLYERMVETEESSPLDSSVPDSLTENEQRLATAMKGAAEGRVVDMPPPSAPLSAKVLRGETDNLDGLVWAFDPSDIAVDAKTFQFKEGGDAAGVTDRLKDVKSWDPVKAGQVLVYEYSDGKRFIADGHQRLGLAKRLQKAGGEEKVTIYGQLFREDDGYSPDMVRVVAAMKNIAEGTGTAIDAAKVLRVDPARMRELPPRSALVRQASDMLDLSDEAFGMVINEVVDANHAAIVGRLVKEPDLQMAILDVLAKTEPANAVQAEAIVRQAMDMGTVKETQIGLFGEETLTTSLFLERAKVLDKALKKLRQDAKVFDTLIRNEDRIAAEGNVLQRSANEQRAATDATAAQMIQTLASRKGPLSDALTTAARRAANDGRYQGSVDEFVGAVRSAIERGDFHGLSAGGSRSGAEIADEAPARSGGPAETSADEETLKLFDTPGSVGAEQQARALDVSIRREAGIDQTSIDQTGAGAQRVLPGGEKISDKELIERKADQKMTSARPQKDADEGLFDEIARDQLDLLDLQVPVAERVDPETGKIVSDTRSVKDILDELDQDALDLDAITLCGKP